VVENRWIIDAVDNLVSTLGVREPDASDGLEAFLRRGETEQCVKAIAVRLGLPVEINLSYVPSNYRPSNSAKFRSSALVKTNRQGRGIDAITAQVLLPSNLPLYGTAALTGYPVQVKVSTNCTRYPLTFITVMAHELAHVLLASLMHPERDSEEWTDLAVMVAGFSEIVGRGRKVITEDKTGVTTTTFGYLSDVQFQLALDKIRRVLRDRKGIRQDGLRHIATLKRQGIKSRNVLFQFESFLRYLDEHPGRRTKRDDAERIVRCHHPSYTREVECAVENSEALVSKGAKECHDTKHYTDIAVRGFQHLKEEIRTASDDLRQKSCAMAEDMRILRRNAGLFFRVRLAVRTRRTSRVRQRGVGNGKGGCAES